MAWTAPMTWNADLLVNQGDLNAQIRDNLTVLAVPIDTATGKIRAIDATCFLSLDGSAITGIARLATANSFSGRNDFGGGAGGRLVLPVGTDKWAT